MTIELFIYLFTIGSAVSGLITQATKKAVKNLSSNVVALVNAVLVGFLGTICACVYLNIPFDAKNIVSALLMGVCIWVGSMLGYDKVIQTINQLRR